MEQDDITDAELRRIEAADAKRAMLHEEKRAERAAAKRRARVFDSTDRPSDLAASGVPIEFHPTKDRHKKFWRFIIPALGADPDGWWYGHCLIHDEASKGERPTAMYNFSKGVMRCLAEDPCHAGRLSMSMSNAYDKWYAATSGVREGGADAEAR